MRTLSEERTAFITARHAEEAEARQTAAAFLSAGLDLATALRASTGERRAMIVRLDRLIERERLKGATRHWSYDINRHIALKQARDRIAGAGKATRPERDRCEKRAGSISQGKPEP